MSCTLPLARIASSLPHKRMRCRDFVVPIGADQQQVPHIRMDQQVFEQIERGRIEPLQIVEEERQRMLRPGEHSQEAPEHQLEASLRVLGGSSGTGRLLADDELQLRDQVHHELPIRTQRFTERLTPARRVRTSLFARSGRTRLWKACAKVE